jgi:hypothetical protein
MFQAGAGRRKEGLNQFGLPELAQESEGIAANVFVGMLEIIADAVTE